LCDFLEKGILGAEALGSVKRQQEALDIYKEARKVWSNERKVWELGDLFLK
jgi:hypothetical protein